MIRGRLGPNGLASLGYQSAATMGPGPFAHPGVTVERLLALARVRTPSGQQETHEGGHEMSEERLAGSTERRRE
jgi:hypothetical protein